MPARSGDPKVWLRKAESDLLNIRNNLGSAEVPWDTVCFHAQQAVEKLLKAFLVANGKPAPREHDLVGLLSVCVQIAARFADLESGCRKLTVYATAVRYPVAFAEPTEGEAREAAAIARDVHAIVLGHLSPRVRDGD